MNRLMAQKVSKQIPKRRSDELIVSFYQENSYLIIAIMVYLTLCIAHSVTYMDLMYYYQKIPFLFIFSAYFLNEIDDYQLNPMITLGNAVASFLLLYGIILILAIII